MSRGFRPWYPVPNRKTPTGQVTQKHPVPSQSPSAAGQMFQSPTSGMTVRVPRAESSVFQNLWALPHPYFIS